MKVYILVPASFFTGEIPDLNVIAFDSQAAAENARADMGGQIFHCDLLGDVIAGALEAVLLFHRGGAWGEPERMIWEKITGERDATSRSLCNHIHKVLGAEPKHSRMTFDQWARGFYEALQNAGLVQSQAARYLAGGMYAKTSLGYYGTGVSIHDAVKIELVG